jgi:hypothetical protein
MKTITFLSPLPLLIAVGCVDPAGRLEEFYDRSEPLRVTVQTGECVERLDISGDYLLAIATVVNPSAPILFAADFDIDTASEPWGLTLTLQPVSYTDRSNVGTALVAEGTIASDGTFSLDYGEITILGAANPVVPGVDAVAALLLDGCTNSLALSCGNIGGSIIAPAQLPLTGSTYGAVAVDGDFATVAPISACPVAE